jgi:CheY-like chemotaxis protein
MIYNCEMLERFLSCTKRAPGIVMCILFVDDEPLIVEIASAFLKEFGRLVLTAHSSIMARHFIEIQPADYFTCLVTDYHMPKENGGFLVEHMRPLYPKIPMVLATANGAAVTQGWRNKHGVTLLGKPYSGRDLVNTVKRLFDQPTV